MKKINSRKIIIQIIVVLLISISAIGLASGIDNFKELPSIYDVPEVPTESTAGILSIVGTFENFKALVEDSKKYTGVQMLGAADGMRENTMITAQSKSDNTNNSGNYSKTNVQVEGVDESDSIKNDGKYIYQIIDRKLIVTEAYPANDMKIISTIDYTDNNFYPSGIYIDDSYLVVTGQYSFEANDTASQDSKIKPGYLPLKSMVKAIVYDAKDRSNIKEIRKLELEGNLVSSRKIGTKLYFVTNKYIDYYLMDKNVNSLTPTYKDSVSSLDYRTIGYESIKYFPDTPCSSYMIIGAVDISNNSEMKVDAYLGAGQNIYMSSDSLYVAVTKYEPVKDIIPQSDTLMPAIFPPMYGQNTLIYKFSLNNGDIAFSAKGEVKGRILNQFSMDEYNSYLRIATTSGETWGRGESNSKNNIYVLDNKLNPVGKIEDMAPGEKIYSVRFMGERGFLVTFKTVDPLFVIDFKDPINPKILGALKIPGYSNYLHPYDENHIIGFGKDAIALPIKDGKGNSADTMAFYLGMKIAIFDVTDVTHPVEMFSIKIGDRGTDSEMLYNHKALLFSKEKNLLALPVNLFELKKGQSVINTGSNYPEYGTFTYQGAYIYNIDLINGITLKGRITHKSDDQYIKSGQYTANGYNNIQRILYINDALYTISSGKVKASDINTLADINEVIIPNNHKN